MGRVRQIAVNITDGVKDISLSQESVAPVPAMDHNLGKLEQLPLKYVSADRAWGFGSDQDGVVELAVTMRDGGVVEVGSYYGLQKPKSIIKISSQIGCPASCHFCEVGSERFKRNLSGDEIYEQVALMTQVLRGYNPSYDFKPHKINIAGTGEPMFNGELVNGLKQLAHHNFSFKICTVAPGNKNVFRNFESLARFASNYPGTVQIQISLLSLNEEHRCNVAGLKLMSFSQIGELAELWRSYGPKRDQLNLSLILTDDCPVHVQQALKYFPPEFFRFRFRDYVSTENGSDKGLQAMKEEKVLRIKSDFRAKGYYVSDDATPTATEKEFDLASNVTRRRMMTSYGSPISLSKKK